MRSRILCGLLVMTSLGLKPSLAGAQVERPNELSATGGTLVSLDYRAPPSCPSALAFQRQIAARSDRVEFLSGSRGEPLSIQITEEQGRFSALMHAPSLDGEGRKIDELRRELSDASCEDLVLALAFIAVVALDPSAQDRAAESAASPPEPAKLEPPTTGPAAWRRDLGLNLFFTGAPAPRLMPGLGLSFETVPADTSWRRARVNWAVRGSINAGFVDSVIRNAELPETDRLELLLLAAEFDVCPLRFGWLSACAGAQLGLLRGATAAAPQPAPRFWSALHAAIALRAPVSERWVLVLRGGPSFPLTRDRFGVSLVEGDGARFIQVHEPKLSGFFSVGASVWVH